MVKLQVSATMFPVKLGYDLEYTPAPNDSIHVNLANSGIFWKDLSMIGVVGLLQKQRFIYQAMVPGAYIAM